jgi:hypothetical protein
MLYVESANVNDIISFGQKITLLCHMLAPQFSLKSQAYDCYYRNHETEPTLFRLEFYEGLVANEQAGVWPASLAAEENPFGLECVQGQPIYTTEEQALVISGTLVIDGWFETRGIGI